MSSEARTYLQLSATFGLWLVRALLLGLVAAGCMTENQKAAERSGAAPGVNCAGTIWRN